MDEQQSPPQPDPTHQVGTGKGEEKAKTQGTEPGRRATGNTGEADRPAGKTTGATSTGVNPSEENPVDPSSPHLPTP